MRIKTFIEDLAEDYGFDEFDAVAQRGFTDIIKMILPESLRSRRHGTKFMLEVCAEADRQQAVLALYAEPLFPGRTPEDKTRLINWYEGLGFVESEDDGPYRGRYVRQPGSL